MMTLYVFPMKFKQNSGLSIILDEAEMICRTHMRMLKDYEANDIARLGFAAGLLQS